MEPPKEHNPSNPFKDATYEIAIKFAWDQHNADPTGPSTEYWAAWKAARLVAAYLYNTYGKGTAREKEFYRDICIIAPD